MSAIRVEGLSKSYGAVRALDGLNLSVAHGTVFGFLGPNGAGKTTTIRILTGLARPTSGRAWIAGEEIVGRQGSQAHKIGHLPEEPAFYNWMTPREFLEHVAGIFGLKASERASRAKEMLERVGLADVGRRRIGGFSRGMRQRLGLAQALVNRPSVLLLDEPVSALDPAGRKEVLELIENLRGDCTVLMSSHILADVERVCDTVGIVARGRLVMQAPRDELLKHYTLQAFEVEVEAGCEPMLPAWVDAMRQKPWLTGASIDGRTARISADDVPTAQRELLASVSQSGLLLRRYEMVKPSLEDIFLSLIEERNS
jgi:ABC-2 type transport system ATP-binding protein